jgi:hypothetical protein
MKCKFIFIFFSINLLALDIVLTENMMIGMPKTAEEALTRRFSAA